MNDPFARLSAVPGFTVTSTDVTDGQELPVAQMSGVFGVPSGKDLSPQLSWSGAPAETKSYTSDHVRPRRAQRLRLLALGRRRYPRLGHRTGDRSGNRAWLGFSINSGGRLLGRAVIIPWAEIPAT